MLGGDILLEGLEKTANDILMRAKHREIDDAFNNSATFLPSQSFLLTKEAIRRSPVFKIIQAMAKGSVLHVHESAMVSIDYMFNITYRPNLYARETEHRPVYEDWIYQGLLEAYRDNILYMELRTILSPLYDLNGITYERKEVAKICKNVTERFMQDYPDFAGVKLIYSRSRKSNNSQFEEYLQTARELKKYLPDFLAGFDLVGQEDKGRPLIQFAERLRSLGDDIQLFFHAGEINWYGTSTDENLVDAVLLNTKRIGHGFALLKHPEVMDWVRSKKIAIEISPISSQLLGHVKDLRNHPANYLFANNYPVVISSDDPGLWGAEGLSYDLYEAFVEMISRKADLRALKKLALNSTEYSSMHEAQRVKAMEVWNRKWKDFVTELNRSPSSLESNSSLRLFTN